MPKDEKIIKPIDASFDDVVDSIVIGNKMTNVFKETHPGELKIGDLTIKCSVIDGGIRVLSHRSISTAFTGSHGGGLAKNSGVQKLPRFLSAKSIKPFISNDLMARLNRPIEYQPEHGGRTAFGYEATILPEICEAILDAERAGELKDSKQAIVADTLLRGFARVGIIALVDEATGYQESRARDALAQILKDFLIDERQKWTQTFPLDFYKEIYRLRGWEFKPWTTKRPQVIARWTDDFVYDRLAPSLTEELRNKNPVLANGRRKDKHHQWFNPDLGHPKLKEHISGVIALLKASDDWEGFKRNLNRAYPKFGDTIDLPL